MLFVVLAEVGFLFGYMRFIELCIYIYVYNPYTFICLVICLHFYVCGHGFRVIGLVTVVGTPNL